MGTNYYLHVDPCPRCSRCERKVHVGKSSFGWSFSFRGYRHAWDEPRITSFVGWKAYLADAIAKGCELRDEYGDPVTLDQFLALVEAKRGGRNHTTYCREAGDPSTRRHGLEECWLDEEGHSFSGTEFS